MIRIGAVALFTLGLAAPALADATLSLSLPLDRSGGVISASYSCDGGAAFPVRYVNAGANALALIPIDDEERIFVNVISGSGARYVSGQYEWWVKGDAATLTDRTSEESAAACVSVGE